MTELERLIAALKACHTEMSNCLDRAKAATKDEDRAKFTAAFEAKQLEYDSLKADLEQAKSLAEVAATVRTAEALLTTDTQGKTVNPAGASGSSSDPNSVQAKSIEPVNNPAKDEHERTGFFLKYCAEGPGALEGKQFAAISARNAIDRNVHMAKQQDAVLIPARMRNAMLAQQYGGKVILSTDATGGATDSGAANLVAPDFHAQLMSRPVAAPALYDMVRLLPAANGKATWPKLDQGQGEFGGVAFTWKSAEGEDKGETEPVFTDFEITTSELSGWTEMSLSAMTRSSIGLEAVLTDLFRQSARYEFSKQILSGNGTNKPLGIRLASGTNLVTRAGANAVGWGDLVNLEYAVPMAMRMGGRYLITDPVEKHLKGQVDDQDRPIFTSDTAGGIRSNLAGYPYLAHEYSSIALGAAGDVVFGNWQYYGWAVEEDIAIARSEHAEFKKGRVVFRMICFVGGKPIYANAFSILDDEVTT